MDETAYKEMEGSLSNVSAQHALKLGNLFNVEPEYFLANDGRGPELINTFMDGVTTILKDTSKHIFACYPNSICSFTNSIYLSSL